MDRETAGPLKGGATKLRILVDFAVPPEAIELLRQGTSRHELIFAEKPNVSVLAESEPDPRLATANIAFGQPDPGAIERAERLRWLHVSTSGITRYDNEAFRAAMRKRSIVVSNSALVYNEACAVHALSFMLADARNFPVALGSRIVGGTDEWHALRTSCTPLQGQTVLIVGYGAIGRRLAELLAPFNMRVLAYRRRARGDEGVPVVTEKALPGVLGEADHVVNILPHSDSTEHFFDAKCFDAFKSGSVFYNIGRGSTVAQDALLAVLRSGRLKSAWLDVTDPEPLPEGHPLLTEPNCHITPHIAGGHAGEGLTLVRHFLANLERFERGEPLLDQVI